MIRILIADDSELVRVVLRDLLSGDPELEVVAEVSDGRAAVEQAVGLKPDLIIMDVMMPVMDGIEAVAQIMAKAPTPILMLSTNTDPQDSRSAFAAIKLGALDVMEKPSGVVSKSFSQIAEKLITKIKSLSRIRVIHHYRAQRSEAKVQQLAALAPEVKVEASGSRRILAIGASTGGPKAVLQLLQDLPKTLDATVLVVQHIADGFAPGFADWLNRESGFSVKLAAAGSELNSGTVLVAPNNLHLAVQSQRVVLEKAPPLHNCRPAVDALFLSLSGCEVAAKTVAVLLTGMGQDGAAGLLSLHRNGAHTIAQDESSCAVFGMPKKAIELGAATQVLPLESIGAAVSALFARR